MKKIVLLSAAIFGICLLAFGGFVMLTRDPFGGKQKYMPNCSEFRYDFNSDIDTKEDFVRFVKENQKDMKDQYGNNWVKLDNFFDAGTGETDWEKVFDSVDTDYVGLRKIYLLKYRPDGLCSEWTLKATKDGMVALYGCCGI